MSDLVEFLRARLDEDEACVRAAESDPGYEAPVGYEPWYANNADSSGDAIVAVHPARALAEVEAKRRAIERCRSIAEVDGWEYTDAPDLAGDVMRALAQPYSDHPDFDPAWTLQ